MVELLSPKPPSLSELIVPEHKVIILHGLGPEDVMLNAYKLLTRHWYKRVEPLLPRIEWTNGDFNDKFIRVLRMIERIHDANYRVSLVGTSAGGSLALNAFLERPDIINAVVVIGSHLRDGMDEMGHDLEWVATSERGVARAFIESVHRFERLATEMPISLRERVLSLVTPGDEFVPMKCQTLEGAINIMNPAVKLPLSHKFPFLGVHAASIVAALTKPGLIVDFLESFPPRYN